MSLLNKSGVVQIQKAIGKFQGIIDELTSGTEKVNQQVVTNIEAVKVLEAETEFLKKTVDDANIFKTNLVKMLKKDETTDSEDSNSISVN
jgi:regulator of replication initiation timing